jgi:membrane protease YdiL (CAAX protease family)
MDALVSLLAIAVMPALCEESLMRGVLLPSLATRMPKALALVISSVAFAAMHDLYRMPFTFAVGLVLGALRLRTGSLLPCLITHATLNALTFAAAPFLDDPEQALPDPRPLLGGALLLTGCLLAAHLVRRLPPSLTKDASAP